jgi:hypothetical protein
VPFLDGHHNLFVFEPLLEIVNHTDNNHGGKYSDSY